MCYCVNLCYRLRLSCFPLSYTASPVGLGPMLVFWPQSSVDGRYRGGSVLVVFCQDVAEHVQEHVNMVLFKHQSRAEPDGPISTATQQNTWETHREDERLHRRSPAWTVYRCVYMSVYVSVYVSVYRSVY